MTQFSNSVLFDHKKNISQAALLQTKSHHVTTVRPSLLLFQKSNFRSILHFLVTERFYSDSSRSYFFSLISNLPGAVAKKDLLGGAHSLEK